jgi:diacylglycerol kinase (ATP)
MKWLAILNSHSGGRGAHHFQDFSALLKRELDADIVWTARRNHAKRLVHLHKDYDGYIAVGGDGTVSEVVNAFDLDKQCLGIIPAGTGNGLARDLGLSDEMAAIHALKTPHFERLDVITVRYLQEGTWRDKTLISTSGIGYLAGATEIGESPCKRLGSWWYAVAAVAQSLRQEEFPVQFRLDQGPWQEKVLTTLIVHNNQYVGQFRIFPEASLTDGRLNMLYGRLSPWQQLFEDLGILTQTYLFARTIRLAPRKIEIRLPIPRALMIDGDVIEKVQQVSYEVAPGRLRCCTASAGAREPANIRYPAKMSA